MNVLTAAVLFASVLIVIGREPRGVVVNIVQNKVCITKRSCVDCLRLTHCSWCKLENKCFSNMISPNFCKNDTNEYTDFGFSLEENAECGCGLGTQLVGDCRPPVEDLDEEPLCSGRGRCVCGRCICETYDNSTKIVMGDYCEYDNFSCVGPGCNEGPYSLKQPELTPPEA